MSEDQNNNNDKDLCVAVKKFQIIFAKNVVRFRDKKGWSQETLAKKCNVSRPTIAKLENKKGHQIKPSFDSIVRLAFVFDVEPNTLFIDEGIE